MPMGGREEPRDREAEKRQAAQEAREAAALEARKKRAHQKIIQGEIPERKETPPNFETKELHTQDAEKKDARASLVEKAQAAIVSGDLGKLKVYLGPSIAPLRIQYNQGTQTRRWEWMKINRELIFYRQAERLVKNYIKYRFHRTLLNDYEKRLTRAHQEKKQDLENQVKYFNDEVKSPYQRILAAPALKKRGVLALDRYVSAVDEAKSLKTYLDKLISGFFGSDSWDTREMDEKECAELKTLLQAELKELSDESVASSVDSLQQNLVSDVRSLMHVSSIGEIKLFSFGAASAPPVVESKNNAPHLAYPRILSEEYKQAVQRNDPLFNEFIRWFDAKIKSSHDHDIVEIYGEIQREMLSREAMCQRYMDEQKTQATRFQQTEEQEVKRYQVEAERWMKANLPPQREEKEKKQAMQTSDAIVQSGIALDADLIAEGEEGMKKEDISLLHRVFLQYNNAESASEKQKLLPFIHFLLARGCCAFTKKEAKTERDDPFMFKIIAKNPDWILAKMILTYMPTRSPATEKLRVRLLKYCEDSIEQLNSWGWRFSHWGGTATKNEVRLPAVVQLTEFLYYAQRNFSDVVLLKNARDICVKQSSFTNGSELWLLLDEVIKEVDGGGLLHLSARDVGLQLMPSQQQSRSGIAQPARLQDNAKGEQKEKKVERDVSYSSAAPAATMFPPAERAQHIGSGAGGSQPSPEHTATASHP